ncbi:hypothetical protein VSX64_23955 [Aurantimonas sp. C2-6-R+9]|uniref:hypothetical protein n=1 Tax=unclassified Aurantimonas TaxID=2638230 RepID=UPI002E174F56|nr:MULTISPECIES: hypothetical protein [unclassified Aurantimonas]MEC5293600.1 hypothetical protein [Aurantimonas sp. C2-3-R2]MEC5383788.1 hypothetical protein [Aurantimonas sp. C2-6-R+9]MEC5414668.1 hypothetical protein [Aurantimonas sp. C2-4-R8]
MPALRQSGSPCLAAGIVYCGILEFCLRHHVRHLSIVCETYWFDRLTRLGWNPRPLGPPITHRGDTIIGLIVDISVNALETTRQTYALSRSVLSANTTFAPPEPVTAERQGTVKPGGKKAGCRK